jgi:hypothetical protein
MSRRRGHREAAGAERRSRPKGGLTAATGHGSRGTRGWARPAPFNTLSPLKFPRLPRARSSPTLAP